LYTTGIRIGELCKLNNADFDVNEKTLKIVNTKFNKTRIIPITDHLSEQLDYYIQYKKKVGCNTAMNYPLIYNCNSKNYRYSVSSFSNSLKKIFAKTGVLNNKNRCPRVHDLRHTFAVHVLLKWYLEGKNVQAKIVSLSKYMGHSSLKYTEYYLKYVEPLSEIASSKFQEKYGDIIKNEGIIDGKRI
jgi:integrase